ncbi:hypothetical protein [Nonomuraea soli]|uniref:Uncharacterized protein n=1 Tax=Nonomuraea soli TaxID=1032476 RepID=A0A7W0HW07_9ACTN|nr:hypothetical protein [Nonomuraea soli]MBA2897774.1 hypothetical protein [Nonomuraea soli]
MAHTKLTNPQSRLAVLVTVRHEGIPAAKGPGVVRAALRWLMGRPLQQHQSVARRAGLRADSVATRLVVIPDSASLRKSYGSDRVPFIIEASAPAEAVQLVRRCQDLMRADLARALPFKRRFTLLPSEYIYDTLAPIAGQWPVPVGTCDAYKEAHDAMAAYVMNGDEEKAMDFAKKWQLTIRRRSAVLNGLLGIGWGGVELFNNDRVIAALNRQIRTERNNLLPLHERKLEYRHIEYLDDPDTESKTRSTRGMSRRRTATRRNPVEDHAMYSQPFGHHPCLDALLVDFSPAEAHTVAMYVFSETNADWHDAALLAQANNPKQFGERVRRKFLRAMQKHRSRTNSAACQHDAAANQTGA